MAKLFSAMKQSSGFARRCSAEDFDRLLEQRFCLRVAALALQVGGQLHEHQAATMILWPEAACARQRPGQRLLGLGCIAARDRPGGSLARRRQVKTPRRTISFQATIATPMAIAAPTPTAASKMGDTRSLSMYKRMARVQSRTNQGQLTPARRRPLPRRLRNVDVARAAAGGAIGFGHGRRRIAGIRAARCARADAAAGSSLSFPAMRRNVWRFACTMTGPWRAERRKPA